RRGNYLTFILVEHDPVYMTEPLIRSTEYQIDAHQNIPPYPCNVVEEVDRPKGVVPHNMPGTSAYTEDVKDFANRYGIPWNVITAGAATMYPEIQSRLKAAPSGAVLAAESPRTTSTPPAQERDAADVEVLPIHGSVYLISGGGANIAASVGKDGVLVVDSGAAAMTDRVLAAIRQLQTELVRREPAPQLGWGAETRGTLQQSLSHIAPPKPIRYIVNTSADPDHVGGNEKLVKAGKTFTGGNVAGDIADAGQGAAVIAYENVLTRVSAPTGEKAALPTDGWPTDTFFQASMK